MKRMLTIANIHSAYCELGPGLHAYFNPCNNQEVLGTGIILAL